MNAHGPELPPFSRRRLVLVLGLALVASAGAFWLSMQRQLPRDARFGIEALPGLAGQLPNVDRIQLRTAAGTVTTLARREGHFVVLEQGGYAASGVRVHDLLIALADLRVARRRRVTPAQWPEFGLAPGVRVELGGRLSTVALSIGERTGPENAYVRIGDADEVLEVGPAPVIDAEARAWLAHPLLDIAPGEIRRIASDSGASVRLAPDQPFIAEVVAGGRAARARAHRPDASIVQDLDFDALRPVTGGTTERHATIETYAGLRVDCAGYVEGTHHWLRISAAVATPADTTTFEATRVADAAARLNARAGGFEFDVPAAAYGRLFSAPDPAPGS